MDPNSRLGKGIWTGEINEEKSCGRNAFSWCSPSPFSLFSDFLTSLFPDFPRGKDFLREQVLTYGQSSRSLLAAEKKYFVLLVSNQCPTIFIEWLRVLLLRDQLYCCRALSSAITLGIFVNIICCSDSGDNCRKTANTVHWLPCGLSYSQVMSWKSKLPLQTIMRLLQVLVPQVEKICIDK